MTIQTSDSWPAHLDACEAAASFHRVMLENDQVRVLETIVEPGQIVPLHTHHRSAVTTFFTTSSLVRRDEHGTVLMDTRTLDDPPRAGQAVMTPPLGPHTLENVGDTPLHAVTVELKITS